ncbi:Succinate-semialdehyde dehydrogenase [NADP(+)] [Fonsecaea pedrosoi]|nr:Succinate-semialdehyde dehydrogenase [NADP(+)] [Fonsecaea pedrosoi]
MAEPRFQTLNPATEVLIKEFPFTTDNEVNAAINTAHEAFQKDWRWRSAKDRAAVISKVAKLMRERSESLARLVVLEMGKPIDMARFELDISIKILEYFAEKGEALLATRTLPQAPGSRLALEPLGILLAIEPWNFPIYQVARVIGPHMMAGNVVIVKHAPSVPQCALALETLFKDADAPTGLYTNIFATIPQVNRLIEDFRVRGVTLTGSEVAGAAVAERAGRNLKKVVLELGGSDPLIILEDAPLAAAIQTATIGRLMQSGQSCAASKRVIVIGKERGQLVLDGLRQSFSTFQAGDPFDPSTTLGPIFAERGLTKLLQQVETAKRHGAQIVMGGQRVPRPGFFMEPTIITDISPDNPLYGEETFGPILSFYVVESEDEAIRLANATRFGLGASVITSDMKRAADLAARIESGMVFINSFVYSGPEVPFGGVKNSGFGRELSDLGLMEFVNQKLIRETDL